MKILICGDSFSANWAPPVPDCTSWVDMLRTQHDVVNLSQAGCGEYKIFKQIKSQNLNNFDKIIVCHTSPFRIHIDKNPLHKTGMHQHSDFIFSDVEASPNSKIKDHVLWWFQHVFDVDYAITTHSLIKKEIFNLTKSYDCIHINFFSPNNNEYTDKNEINFNHVWKSNPGKVNHMDCWGNLAIFKKLTLEIQ